LFFTTDGRRHSLVKAIHTYRTKGTDTHKDILVCVLSNKGMGYRVQGTFDIGQPPGTGSRFEDGRKFTEPFLFQFATGLSFFGLLVDTKVSVTLK